MVLRLLFVSFAVTGPALHPLRASHWQGVLIGDKICSAEKYGAKGDGVTDDTKALQKAIADCGSKGGGQVVLPAGTGKGIYLSKALTMSYNHLELNIPKGATLKISNDRKNWPKNQQFIFAQKVQHIAITGKGGIDGQGLVWWQNEDKFRPHTVQFKDVTKPRAGIVRRSLRGVGRGDPEPTVKGRLRKEKRVFAQYGRD
jgi:polygalacturonase